MQFRRVLLALVLSAFTLPGAAHAEARQEYVRVTYYLPTGNPMRDEQYPFVGAAACGNYFPQGTRLRFNDDGFVVTCTDTGELQDAQIDVFAPTNTWGIQNVEAIYGLYAWVTVVRWGPDYVEPLT